MGLLALRTTDPVRLSALIALRSLIRGFNRTAQEMDGKRFGLHDIRRALETGGLLRSTRVTEEEVDALISHYGGEEAFVWGIGRA